MPYVPPPPRAAGFGEFCVGVLLGVPILWLGINTFFAAMPLAERFGQFVCHHLIGGGL